MMMLFDSLNRLFFDLFHKKKVFYVNKDSDLENVILDLHNEEIICVDTEFEWRRTYFPIISLIQIATKNKIHIIDCLECESLSCLESIFCDDKKLFIFHASRSDTTVISKCLNFQIKNVFDIQIAENILTNDKSKSYQSLVYKYFKINLAKSETHSNWLLRPLSKRQIDYASEDVTYLIEIFEKQSRLLKKKNIYKDAIKDSEREAYLGNQDLIISRLKKLKDPSETERNIFIWRENISIKKNIPPSHAIKDKRIRFLSELVDQKRDLSGQKKFFSDESIFLDFLDNFK
jgi:ribonuclease D